MSIRTRDQCQFWETVRIIKMAGEYFVFQQEVAIKYLNPSRIDAGPTTYREITDHRLIPLMNLIDEKELVQHLEMDEDVDDMKEL